MDFKKTLTNTIAGTITSMAFAASATAAPDIYLFEGNIGHKLDVSPETAQIIAKNFETGRGDCYGNLLYDSKGLQDQLDKSSKIDNVTIREIRQAIFSTSLTEIHPDGAYKKDTSLISVTESIRDCANLSGEAYTTYSNGNGTIIVEDSVPAAINHTPNWVR